jgi:mannonate dehydratase
MSPNLSRRDLVAGMCSTALLSKALPALAKTEAKKATRNLPLGIPQEGPGTPKLAAPLGARNITDKSMREVKQLGVNHVLMGGPPMPWTEPQLRSMVDKCKTGGLTISNMMISGFPNTVYGRPGRDQEIEQFKDSIRAAGKVGIPTIEYNFYAHRAIEGYYEVDGRGGAGLTGFDVDQVQASGISGT